MDVNARKSKDEVYSYLKRLTIGILSTVSDRGKPYASVIYFVADHNLNFFFITKSDTKKAQNLEKNNNAAITILDPENPKTIQATGTARKVQDPDIYSYMLKRIAEENSKKGGFYWPPPISKLKSMGDLVMYRLEPDWLRFGDFTESAFASTTSTKTNIFYQVIP
ncbi:MAG: hypothetical protein A3D74_00080 [Candidatus Levybacteria bacterium RIFCSPHIGHO2_02_FULL_37_13]|nr:MAG: hypothetical protein A3D74_00080 [Candidatus Levybacteria bacterium RIFCSPHIGHO2_02_FULL_37_13]OGH28980.1 MAG: hypothetical protein A3E40_05025 [Candidatus Levybacteria bacterium RIFCSPHIGHO2_12_FULL_37_9]OGH39569.1 MAG: hypothetical protein A3B41_00385 [Candidatus Levybacteria bacterium RIFCSPLOWO2_01_FULL_37_26]